MAFLQPGGAATIARRVGSDTNAAPAAHCGGGRGPTGLYLVYAAAATKDPCCTTAATGHSSVKEKVAYANNDPPFIAIKCFE